jgi:hypothetical protein
MQRQPREKCEKHLRWLRTLPCVLCRNPIETEAAHVRMACLEVGKPYTGKGEKPSDKWAVPLCSRHHHEQHEIGEREFWLLAGIDPIRIASDLWARTGNQEAGEQICAAAHERVAA